MDSVFVLENLLINLSSLSFYLFIRLSRISDTCTVRAPWMHIICDEHAWGGLKITIEGELTCSAPPYYSVIEYPLSEISTRTPGSSVGRARDSYVCSISIPASCRLGRSQHNVTGCDKSQGLSALSLCGST